MGEQATLEFDKSYCNVLLHKLVKTYSLVQSQRMTDVIVTECSRGKTERARIYSGIF